MAKPFVVDITENNTPIARDAVPAGKKGSCGGRCGGKCGGHAKSAKTLQLALLAALVAAGIACYFFSI